MSVRELGHVVLYVHELERSRVFYRDVLGFPEVLAMPPQAAVFSGGRTHSRVEQRFYWIGKSGTGRILTTRFTRRGQRLRIIGSAEWRKFRRIYETAKSK